MMSLRYFIALKKVHPNMPRHKVFAIGDSTHYAKSFCDSLKIKLSTIKEDLYPETEIKLIPLEDVRNCHVTVWCALTKNSNQSISDKLCALLFFLNTLKDSGAAHINVILPYLAYSRSDQKHESYDSLTLRYLAQLLEASGANGIVTLDVHNISAFENAFRCQAINLPATSLFAEYLMTKYHNENLTILSPDIGGIKRAEKFQEELQKKHSKKAAFAFLEKYRKGEALKGQALVGQVTGQTVVILDDIISTGSTILRAVNACHNQTVGKIIVCATHGLFTKNPEQLLNSNLVTEVVVTDSNPDLLNEKWRKDNKLKVIPCAAIFLKSVILDKFKNNLIGEIKNGSSIDAFYPP